MNPWLGQAGEVRRGSSERCAAGCALALMRAEGRFEGTRHIPAEALGFHRSVQNLLHLLVDVLVKQSRMEEHIMLQRQLHAGKRARVRRAQRAGAAIGASRGSRTAGGHA